MLINNYLSKLDIKKILLENLKSITGSQAEQESQIMISYSSNSENNFAFPFFDLNLFNLNFLLDFMKIITSKYLVSLLSINKGISKNNNFFFLFFLKKINISLLTIG